MSHPLRALPQRERRVAVELLLMIAGALVLLGEIKGIDGLVVSAVGVLVGATLLVVVEAPVGSVPLGYALLISVAALANAGTYFSVLALALLVTLPVLVIRHGPEDTARRIISWLIAGCVCGLTVAGMRVLVAGSSPDVLLVHATVAGAVFLVIDLVGRSVLPTATASPMHLREAWPVHISLLCGAGLLTVAYEHDPWMAVVALIPLVLVRFAYERYAAAKNAYQQTIKALSIVPEVAGVTPMGHGERSAVYAGALARQLGFSPEAIERVTTAARLHHIGYVTLDALDEADTVEARMRLARQGGDILRETEFLADVGDLVESVHAVEVTSREAAVVRIATAFDHLVLEDPARALGALQLLNFQQSDPYGAAAALVLRQVLEEDPAVVDRAIASGAPLTEAVAASGGHRD